MASPIYLTPQPVRVDAAQTQPLDQAVDVSDADHLDLLLYAPSIEGTSTPTATIRILTGMQKDTESGWVTSRGTATTERLDFAPENYQTLVSDRIEDGDPPAITTPQCVPTWWDGDQADRPDYLQDEWSHWVDMNMVWWWCAANAHLGACAKMTTCWVPPVNAKTLIPEAYTTPIDLDMVKLQLATGDVRCPWS
jgi:hypothetical protein